MKVFELIEKLKGFEDFDIRIVIVHPRDGEQPFHTEHGVSFEDIGYSGKVITLGIDG